MTAQRKVVLNADDLGYDPAVTRGIVESMNHGIVSSTTMMVNTPFSEDAARQVRGLPVGLHLNLARWGSVFDARTVFVEGDASSLDPVFVEHETLAQLDRLNALVGQRATHIDVHKHLHRSPNILRGVIRAARARELAVRSPDEAVRSVLVAHHVVTNDVMLGDAEHEAYWTLETLERELKALPETGFIELMCHPGHAPSEVKSGYSAQREVELATFTSEKARGLLVEFKLTLDSWS